MSEKIDIFYEATPNPQSMKFVVTKQISNESAQFNEPSEALRSPLAAKLFGFPWCEGVFIGPSFVTVTKQDWVDWTVLADPLSHLIKEHIDANEPIMIELATKAPVFNENDSDDVKKIKTIIESEIRPAVAMDGGDIVFDRYEDNIVYVQLKGACSGCPSSSMTLKQGVESRLKQSLPNLKEVIAIM